ncbi:hypothetical protein FB446DRAFT_754399 [Lentinula raphanica]|nr:hypothetical protein FB446DRAFT_754399 [Lentinula raphanica]
MMQTQPVPSSSITHAAPFLNPSCCRRIRIKPPSERNRRFSPKSWSPIEFALVYRNRFATSSFLSSFLERSQLQLHNFISSYHHRLSKTMNRFALRIVLVVGAVSTAALAAPTFLPPSGASDALSGHEEPSVTLPPLQVDPIPSQGLDVREPLATVLVDPVTGTDDLSDTDNTWSSGDVDVGAHEHGHIQDAVADASYEHVNLNLGRRTEGNSEAERTYYMMLYDAHKAEEEGIRAELKENTPGVDKGALVQRVYNVKSVARAFLKQAHEAEKKIVAAGGAPRDPPLPPLKKKSDTSS